MPSLACFVQLLSHIVAGHAGASLSCKVAASGQRLRWQGGIAERRAGTQVGGGGIATLNTLLHRDRHHKYLHVATRVLQEGQ